jgi:tyrosyl-tRNA synthetase
LTTPLLEGLDGGPKMSKSLGNAIGLNEPADKAFGKLMSISDELMWHYFAVLLAKSPAEIETLKSEVASGKQHPMQLKKNMAHQAVTRFWGAKSADEAQTQFEALFQKKDYSQAQEVVLPANMPELIWIIDLLKELKAITSSSEGRRLIEAGAVSINGAAVTDFQHKVACNSGMIIKVGKHRIYKIK